MKTTTRFVPATRRRRRATRAFDILSSRARRLLPDRASSGHVQHMPITRNKALLAALPVLLLCILLIGGYELWVKLARPAADARRATLTVLPAIQGTANGAAPSSPGEPETIDVQPREMLRIEPGTVITKRVPAGWTDLVLHGVPRVSDGDVEKVSGMLSRLVSLFHLTILAEVAQNRSQHARYRLDKVGIGLAMKIKGREVIVSTKTQDELGANLRLMEQNALSGNEACLDQALQVARTRTMVIFDATAIMRLQEENRNVFDRHALLVSPTDGRLATFVWALERDSKGTYHLASGKIRKLPRGLEEDRKLYVDRSRFVLGLPAQEAFALLDLPPGDTITPSAELQEAAESALQTPEDVTRLQGLLRREIDSSTGQPAAKFRRATGQQARDL